MKFLKRTKKNRGGKNSTLEKIKNSLLPFWYNKLEFPKVQRNNQFLNEETWKPQLDLLKGLYSKKSHLPKGSILFHGSPFINPIKNLRQVDRPFFFGLDAFIAIWYISEWAASNSTDLEKLLSSLVKYKENYTKRKKKLREDEILNTEIDLSLDTKIEKINIKQSKFIESLKFLPVDTDNIEFFPKLKNYDDLVEDINSKKRQYFFLNIYETKENIPFKFLEWGDHPSQTEICKKIACLHPQFGFHVDDSFSADDPVELSVEFTIPANKIGNKLKLLAVYVIDLFILIENRNKNFNEFKATDAIVLEANFTQKNTSLAKSLSNRLGSLTRKAFTI